MTTHATQGVRRWRRRREGGILATGRDWPLTGGSVADTGLGFLASAWTPSLVMQSGLATEATAKRAVERWLAAHGKRKVRHGKR